MTVYAFRCKDCGTRADAETRDPIPCSCGALMKRDWGSVQLSVPTFKPHFNHAVGEYVTSNAHFNDMLKLKGEKAGSNFVRVDPGDMAEPTKGTEIFETRDKLMRDNNVRPESLV